MSDSELFAQGSRCYETFNVMDDMNDFGLWTQGSKSYEQLRAVVDMNKSWSCKLGI